MSEYSLAEKARQSLLRTQAENSKTLTAVVKDDSNEASFPGFPYRIKARGSSIIVNVDIFKSGYECKSCKGSGQVVVQVASLVTRGVENKLIECEDCKGKGALLHLADESKNLPSTGVVVSIGADVVATDINLYDRVIFGPFSGRFLPISKAGVMLKIMDQREATGIVYGGEDLAAFDFIDIPKEG